MGRGPAAPSSRTIEPFFARFAEIHPFKLAPGMTGRPLFSEGAMIDLIELESGAVVALHSHPHEQLGFVSRGE